jgi:hypothetical protein
MEDRNGFFRRLNLEHVPSTDGIPSFFISSVKMLRAAFPSGMQLLSPDYNALITFLDHEDFPYRAIAQMLDFAFNLGYVNVLNELGFIEDQLLRLREIRRMETLLLPHGLDAWRIEVKNG